MEFVIRTRKPESALAKVASAYSAREAREHARWQIGGYGRVPAAELDRILTLPIGEVWEYVQVGCAGTTRVRRLA